MYYHHFQLCIAYLHIICMYVYIYIYIYICIKPMRSGHHRQGTGEGDVRGDDAQDGPAEARWGRDSQRPAAFSLFNVSQT